jgi:metallo-beta-lactamase class B
MLLRPLLAVILAAAAAAPVVSRPPEQGPEWASPIEPFRIAGNVYYVGTAALAAYLVTGSEGHVLIDGAMPQNADRIADNIRRLGFEVEDVEILLNNHAHLDHAGGLARLKELSGARLFASAGDRPTLESGTAAYRDDYWWFPPVAVDEEVEDGESVRLGDVALTAHLTPGHTKGCTSWSMHIAQDGRPLEILFACSLTVAGQPLVNDPRYPDAAADFERSFVRLRTLRADIFLGYHGGQFGFDEKRRRLAAGDALAFVDPAELIAQVDRAEAAFRRELDRQRGETAQ